MTNPRPRVVVIGLGYVGLPLAVSLARNFDAVGFDIDTKRIEELKSGHDATGEIDRDRLETSALRVTHSIEECGDADFYIVTVPTPIDDRNRPDLTILKAASATVGAMVASAVRNGKTPIIVYESTVYPGVTEEICGPIVEETSGLVSGKDFLLGYSPERINPGDREHTVDKIAKVVSAQTPEALDAVAGLYGHVTSGEIFRTSSIKVAEAAKVIENAQRDINIAFMNEIAQIFEKLEISIWDVLAAAGTKWNFLPFTPGLVGGHCIGVDPYYLSHQAEMLGHDPKVILAGRSVNDGMADWVAGKLHSALGDKPSRVLVLGLTFKENVPDLRNSKVADLVAALRKRGHNVLVDDPLADPEEALHEYGIALDRSALGGTYDMVLLAVPHEEYVGPARGRLRAALAPGGILADLKGALRGDADWTL